MLAEHARHFEAKIPANAAASYTTSFLAIFQWLVRQTLQPVIVVLYERLVLANARLNKMFQNR